MPDLAALIPLDGTKLSESALVILPFLKSIGISKVRLVGVWESAWEEPGRPTSARKDEFTEVAERGRAYLDAYLKEKADSLRSQGLAVETIARVGRAAEEVLSQAHAFADLIVVATHGRSGVARWRLGSVADKVVRGADCPVLVIGPNVSLDLARYEPKRILVPLDGSELAEESLNVARWLADKSGAGIDLVRVVPPPVMAGEGIAGIYPVDLLEALEEGAGAYLQETAKKLNSRQEVRVTTLTGTIGDQLFRYLETNPADLIVMTSHSRKGVLRWVLGSIADRLLHGPAPVLVLRPSSDGLKSRLVEAATAARAAS